jgi:predicted metal-dependent peptidase
VTDRELNDKLLAARFRAFHAMPYIAEAVASLIPRRSDKAVTSGGTPTVAVTAKWVMLWHPKAVEEWPVDELAWAMVHEVNHCLRAHHARAAGMDHTLANYCQDAEINDDFTAAPLRPTATDVLPSALMRAACAQGMPASQAATEFADGRMFEDYYAAFPRKAPPKMGPDGGGGRGECGSCAGNALPDESDGGTTEDGKPQPGQDAITQEIVRKRTAEAVQDHVRRRGAGSVPAGLQMWAEAQLAPPKVRWQDVLGRKVRRAVAQVAGKLDYARNRMSRRQGAIGYGYGKPLLPGMVRPVPRVSVIVDTSGSMSGDGAVVLAELAGILKCCDDVRMVSCDAEVHWSGQVRSNAQVRAHALGGGGTVMGPGFARAAAEGAGDLIVCITDGGIFDLDSIPQPSAPVLWVLTQHYNFTPPWGEVLVAK